MFLRVSFAMQWFQREWVWHLGFWMIYLSLRLFVVQMYEGPFYFRLGLELLEVPLKMLALYLAIYVLIGKLLSRKKYLLFVSASFVCVMAMMWLNRLEDYFLIYPLSKIPYVKYEAGFWSIETAFYNLIYVYPVVGLGTTVYFVRSWFDNQLAKEKLAREKAEIELKVLRDQIHPHFLFNTLNNIYSLALQQSAKTADMMLRLSKLLSFMIYEGNHAKVPLSREVAALKDYIELERLRLGERLEISFDATGPVETIQIAPLLFFPLLENCFKHGSHQTTERIWIRFHLQASSSDVVVQIENSLPADPVSNAYEGSGLGLANVRKRLALLYPRHELRIHHSDTYLVYLKIQIV